LTVEFIVLLNQVEKKGSCGAVAFTLKIRERTERVLFNWEQKD